MKFEERDNGWNSFYNFRSHGPKKKKIKKIGNWTLMYDIFANITAEMGQCTQSYYSKKLYSNFKS